MATGRIGLVSFASIKRYLHVTAIAAALISSCALAADVQVVGLMSGRAVLVIDGGKPVTLKVGESTPGGVKLVSATSTEAVIEVGGKRRTLGMGESGAIAIGSGAATGRQSVILTADSRGHFVTTGYINGIAVQMLVDTGASLVSMGASEARRLGINYTAGKPTYTSTANGVVPTYRVKLDTVQVGDVTIHNVDGNVHAGDKLPVVLLGMSFLNRMEMTRDGDRMTLTKRY